MNYYYFIFYWLYKQLSKLGNWYVERSAHYILTLLVSVNIHTILLLAEIFLFHVFYLKYIMMLVILLVFAINFYLFIYRKKYLLIIRNFDKRKEIYTRGTTIVLIYLLISFLSILITFSLKPR
jgi:hypothetical protein